MTPEQKEPFALGPADTEAFARNMARFYEEYGKAVAAYVAPRETGETPKAMPDETADVAKTLAAVAERWLSDPARAVEAQTRLWKGYIDLWASASKRLMGEPAEPVASPDPRDKRFQDADWQRNVFFDFMKQIYLLTARWAEHMVDDADGLDAHTRHKAEFYVRQISAAMSPSNYLMTNPELLRETFASNGANLVEGMRMLSEDLKAGHGELKLRQSDPTPFKLGENLATTPGAVVFRNDLIELIQYQPATETVFDVPTLVVPPWINKFYILDLTAEKSFIRWMTEQGQTVFVISWVNPDARLAMKSFEDYMKEGIIKALDVIGEITGKRKANAIGYCVGGTLLAVSTAWAAATGDDGFNSATFLTTQVDFTHAGDLKVFVDEGQLAHLESRMKQKGYLEGRRMAGAFNMLRANDLIWPYVVNTYIRGRQPLPFDLLYWNSDSTRMPAANHAFYLRNCYLENRLSQGTMTVGGVTLDLKRVTIPIYNLAAREDHIAPAVSVFIGSKFFGSDVRYVLAGSGHIAGVVNPPAKKKYQYWTGGPAIGGFEEWVAAAQEHPGSWWVDWQDWLSKISGPQVPARLPGTGPYPALEPAPGAYVKLRD